MSPAFCLTMTTQPWVNSSSTFILLASCSQHSWPPTFSRCGLNTSTHPGFVQRLQNQGCNFTSMLDEKATTGRGGGREHFSILHVRFMLRYLLWVITFLWGLLDLIMWQTGTKTKNSSQDWSTFILCESEIIQKMLENNKHRREVINNFI